MTTATTAQVGEGLAPSRSAEAAPQVEASSPAAAGEPKSRSSGTQADQARRRRLAEAHVLAAALYRHAAESDPGGAKALLPRPAFQRHVILSEAKNLGFTVADSVARNHPELVEGQPITSRTHLSAQQLGQICAALRSWMREQGIEEPESARDARARVTSHESPVTTSQWRQLTLLIDRVERELAWSRQHLRNWMKSSLHIRSARPKTSAEALRLIRGLEGVLRHSKEKSQ